jgi:hypothetical protein
MIRTIGIIILLLLGLLLAILLAVLFVPVRYRGCLIMEDTTEIKVAASWLFHLLHVSFYGRTGQSLTSIEEKAFVIRILGIPLGKNKKNHNKRKSKGKKKQNHLKGRDSQAPIGKAENIQVEDTVGKKRPAEAVENLIDMHEEKSGFFDKVKSKIVAVKDKIINTITGIKEKLDKANDKWEEVQRFRADPVNQRGISFTWKQIKKVLSHIKPRKITGRIVFGLSDPADTGLALAMLSMLYPIYGKRITICPDFETEHGYARGQVKLQGRIRVWTLGWIAWKTYRNPDFKHVLKAVK